jgi:hypothetical protein
LKVVCAFLLCSADEIVTMTFFCCKMTITPGGERPSGCRAGEPRRHPVAERQAVPERHSHKVDQDE